MIRDVYHEAVSIGISLAISCVNLWYVNKIEFLNRIKHLVFSHLISNFESHYQHKSNIDIITPHFQMMHSFTFKLLSVDPLMRSVQSIS